MELIIYLRLIRKNIFLIIIVSIIFGAFGYGYQITRPKVYATSAKLLVGGYLVTQNPDPQNIVAGIELVKIYAEISRTAELLQAIIEKTEIDTTIDQLYDTTKTIIIGETSILEINAEHQDPETAALIANTLTDELIARGPNNINGEKQEIEVLETELEKMSEELIDLQSELDSVKELIMVAPSTESSTILRQDRFNLSNQINLVSSNIIQITETLSRLRQSSNSLEVLQHARIPTKASGVSAFVTGGLGTVIGLLLSTAIIFLLHEFDQTIQNSVNLRRIYNVSLLGDIPSLKVTRKPSKSWLVTHLKPLTIESESFRIIQAGLFSQQDDITSNIVITSPQDGEGKSLVTANIGTIIAASGLKVLIVDVGLCNPSQHKIFEIDDEVGLITVMKEPNDKSEKAVLEVITKAIKETTIQNLYVLPRGIQDEINSILHILSNLKDFHKYLEIIQSEFEFDVVLFDTDASLTSSISLVLASSIESKLIIVAEARQTTYEQLDKSVIQFNQINKNVDAILLSRS